MEAPPSGGGADRSLEHVNGDAVLTRSVAASQAAPHSQGLCDWCFEGLSERAVEFNGGVGHPACAEHAYNIILGPWAIPWHPRRFQRQDPLIPFCERLGREAARLGIDIQKLATAVGRASRDG
jgi:hypothetical protein